MRLRCEREPLALAGTESQGLPLIGATRSADHHKYFPFSKASAFPGGVKGGRFRAESFGIPEYKVSGYDDISQRTKAGCHVCALLIEEPPARRR
jgi:hypothetical protein